MKVKKIKKKKKKENIKKSNLYRLHINKAICKGCLDFKGEKKKY